MSLARMCAALRPSRCMSVQLRGSLLQSWSKCAASKVLRDSLQQSWSKCAATGVLRGSLLQSWSKCAPSGVLRGSLLQSWSKCAASGVLRGSLLQSWSKCAASGVLRGSLLQSWSKCAASGVLRGSLLQSWSKCAASGVLRGSSTLHASRRGLSTSTQPPRDVPLFEHDKTQFFRLLSLFCGGQCLFWTYLAHLAYTGLRDTPEPGRSTTLFGVWRLEVNLGSSAWKYGFTLGCTTVGAAIVGLGFLFCRRSVSRVVLHQGGRMVSVFTQSPLGMGRGRKITVALSQVSCYAHRQESPSFIPLKIKGHKFYFLLDKDGKVNYPKLFDTTVGTYRPF
ncbi:transmembrane protein 223 isoform X2 [Nerophis ophidion]|uniref:transmembrane protein 223 isoform X2 n=1 Tax=Nerophis ophidion TaxID=159077 RepID=UPI002ADF9DFB|nr:transmembrane protein 223 isoform X2 [Nerophis ophidion]